MNNLVLKQYVVDVFTDTVFKGNPAAVCLLENWLPDRLMQNIAQENNLSETAFVVKNGQYYELRWFTPGGEIDLCGHATLGTAYVLWHFTEINCSSFSFHTKSGQLTATRNRNLIQIHLPAYHLVQVPVTDKMETAIGIRPSEAWMGRDLVCVLQEEQVISAMPDEKQLKKLDGLLLHLTAKSQAYDCITRSFAPKLGIFEDPVCGSGHCHVIPLWAEKLGKKSLTAFQASRRGGILHCRMEHHQVRLAGETVLYAVSEIHVPA